MIDPEVEAFLEHHGIKGMHWGIRKQREVSPERQAKRDKKAKKFEAKAAKFQTRISDIDSELSNRGYFFGRRALITERSHLTSATQRALKDAEAKRQGKLSSTQKKVLIGGVVAGALVSAVVVNNLHETGELNSLTLRGKAWVNGKGGAEIWNRDETLSSSTLNADEIFQKVVKGVNPDYGGPGTKNNCRRATFAYEMRRRGFDVQATKTSTASGQSFIGLGNAIGFGRKDVAKLDPTTARKMTLGTELPINTPLGAAWRKYGNTGVNHIYAGKEPHNAIFQALAKEPNRSRGEVAVRWIAGGAHSLAYEVVNGKPVVFDTQSGKKFSSGADILKTFGPSIGEAGFTRLDNVPLNANFLMRWLKNAD